MGSRRQRIKIGVLGTTAVQTERKRRYKSQVKGQTIKRKSDLMEKGNGKGNGSIHEK